MVEINKTRSSRLYLLKLSFQWGQSNFSTAVGWTSIASQSCTHRLFSIRSTHLFRQIYQIWTIHCHLIYEYCSLNCFRINFTYKICKLMTIIYSNLVTLKKLISYLAALDFWHSPVWNFKFDELDFFPSLNWILAGYTSSKNPVQTRKKSSSSNLKFKTGECQKLSADR